MKEIILKVLPQTALLKLACSIAIAVDHDVSLPSQSTRLWRKGQADFSRQLCVLCQKNKKGECIQMYKLSLLYQISNETKLS